MKPLLPQPTSILDRLKQAIQEKRNTTLEETVYKADPDPFRYGVKVGYVKGLDEFLKELDRIS